MMKNLFKICLVAGVGFLASCGDEKGDYVKPVSKIDAETPSNALPENSNAEVSDIRSVCTALFVSATLTRTSAYP